MYLDFVDFNCMFFYHIFTGKRRDLPGGPEDLSVRLVGLRTSYCLIRPSGPRVWCECA